METVSCGMAERSAAFKTRGVGMSPVMERSGAPWAKVRETEVKKRRKSLLRIRDWFPLKLHQRPPGKAACSQEWPPYELGGFVVFFDGNF